MQQILRKYLLFPFSLFFLLITAVRNFLYNKKFLSSVKFDLPVIVIGNLSVGGTGKTPHTDYLIRLLKQEYALGILSRGYNRKTKGYAEVQTHSLAKDIGDEPLFYKWKHPNCKVSVCEDRLDGIAMMQQNEEKKLVYLLDDAFQHRALRAGLNILLTDYNNPYTKDWLLPAGNLREHRKGAQRADIIIVSKCPPHLSAEQKKAIIAEIQPKNYQYVFFSHIEYHAIYPVLQQHNEPINATETTVLLLSAIANPKPILQELNKQQFKKIHQRQFADHHQFSINDVHSIIRTYQNIDAENKILLTTEKDLTRLFVFKEEFIKENIEIYCLPISINFHKNEKELFNKAIKHYLSITLPIETENNETII